MSTAWVIEAVDVFEDSNIHIPSSLPGLPPDQFGLDGFEEGFHCGVVIAITFATHGGFEAVLAQDFLVVMRAVLAAAIRMVNTAFGRPSQSDGHVQSPDREVAFHSVTDSSR